MLTMCLSGKPSCLRCRGLRQLRVALYKMNDKVVEQEVTGELADVYVHHYVNVAEAGVDEAMYIIRFGLF